MAASISKADYLRKYISSGENNDKKKKRKKKPHDTASKKGRGLLIVDEDIGIQPATLPMRAKELVADGDVDDEAPNVADIVDERPLEVQLMEQYRQSGRWKTLQESPKHTTNDKHLAQAKLAAASTSAQGAISLQHQVHDSDVSALHLRRDDLDRSPCAQGNSSDTVISRQRHDSDTSPPRRQRHNSDNSLSHHQQFDSNTSPPRRQRHDSDTSPPRRQRHDFDTSPPRRQRHDSDTSPSRRQRHDSNTSPSRCQRHDSDTSPSRCQRHDSDTSPPRRSRLDSDISPPRDQLRYTDSCLHRKQQHHSDISHAARKRHNSGSFRHEPAAAGISQPRNQYSSDKSSTCTKKHDSDISPVRHRMPSVPEIVQSVSSRRDEDVSPVRRQRLCPDVSPPRRRRQEADEQLLSPRTPFPAKKKHPAGELSFQDQCQGKVDGGHPSIPRSGVPKASHHEGHQQHPSIEAKTLGGKKAGLSSAKVMRAEAQALKQKEDETFQKIGADMLGRNAKTVFRDSSGKQRDSAKEALDKQQAEHKRAEAAEKYSRWGQGLKQVEDRQMLTSDIMHEMSKPLARYKDDTDLDTMQRERERAGDPMLAFMRSKKSKGKSEGSTGYPRYNGPAPPPSRFNIWPGYRWDGVDRSNGFEKQYFMNLNNKKAVEEQAYKWSTEDM